MAAMGGPFGIVDVHDEAAGAIAASAITCASVRMICKWVGLVKRWDLVRARQVAPFAALSQWCAPRRALTQQAQVLALPIKLKAWLPRSLELSQVLAPACVASRRSCGSVASTRPARIGASIQQDQMTPVSRGLHCI